MARHSPSVTWLTSFPPFPLTPPPTTGLTAVTRWLQPLLLHPAPRRGWQRDLIPETSPRVTTFTLTMVTVWLFTLDAATFSHDLTRGHHRGSQPQNLYNGGYDFRNGYVYFYRTNAEAPLPVHQNIGIRKLTTPLTA